MESPCSFCAPALATITRTLDDSSDQILHAHAFWWNNAERDRFTPPHFTPDVPRLTFHEPRGRERERSTHGSTARVKTGWKGLVDREPFTFSFT